MAANRAGRGRNNQAIESSIEGGWWSWNRGVVEFQADSRQCNSQLGQTRTKGGGKGTCNYDVDEAF